jgi:hypothetical protein
MSDRQRMTFREMRKRVDAAIAEMNAEEDDPEHQARVVWGEADKEEEERQQKLPAKDRWASALITFGGPDSWDIEAKVFHAGTSGNLALHADFDHGYLLPRGDARQLYNLLQAVRDGIRLGLFPESADGDPATEISVLGVVANTPIKGLTARVLDRVFGSLLASANAVERILNGDEEERDDAWTRDVV